MSMHSLWVVLNWLTVGGLFLFMLGSFVGAWLKYRVEEDCQ